MKNLWKWILLGLAVFLLAFCVALPLLGGWSGMPARMVIGQNWMHGGMMGNIRSFGWLGLIARCIVPLVVIGAIAALVIALLRRLSAPAAPPAPPAPPLPPCPRCGKPVESGWVACPHCGKKL